MSGVMGPKISVVIHCVNTGEFIDEAVDSVLAQTLQDFEVVIVNDGSTDARTNALLAGYRRPRTAVLAAPNRGPAAARNEGIRRTSGEYLCCLDAGDLLEPACLEKTARALDGAPDAGIAGFWSRTFGGGEPDRKPAACTLEEILRERVPPPGALFRREAWRKAGGFDERFRDGYEDWDFWIGVTERGYRALVVPEFLVRRRAREAPRGTEGDGPDLRAGFMAEVVRKHEAAFRAHAVPVLIERELLIGELRDLARRRDEAKRGLLARDGERERRIARLEGEVLRLVREVKDGSEALVQRREALGRLDQECARQQRVMEEKEHELRAVRGSRAWRLGCAFRDAARLPRAALRALRIGVASKEAPRQ